LAHLLLIAARWYATRPWWSAPPASPAPRVDRASSPTRSLPVSFRAADVQQPPCSVPSLRSTRGGGPVRERGV